MLDTNNEYGFVYGNNVNISLLSNLKSDLIYKTSSNISTLLYAQVAQGAEEWFPFTSATYDAAAPTLISTKNQTNLALGAKTGAYYNAFRATASLNLDGTISGNGILIVDGDLTIKNNLSYGSATDRCVFLVTGNLTFAPGVTQAVGHFYVTGGVTATTTSTLTIPRGSIACNGNLTYDRLDITADPYFLQNQDQCEPYRLPGFWPVTDSRLNRP
jgi:hypothetical protein